MANKVLLKKSSVIGKVPLTTDLDYGEIALNYADEKLYFKNTSDQVKFITNYTLPTATTSALGGVKVDGTTITINNGVISSTGGGGGSSAAYNRTSYTAIAGQTTFNITYTVGYVTVYVNGILVDTDLYTATNGTSVVLNFGCTLGDSVDLFAYQAVSNVAITVASTTTLGGVKVDGSTITINNGIISTIPSEKITLSGVVETYINTNTSYTITNYNSFSTYSVTTSAGTVSILNDVITLIPPSSSQTITLTVSKDGISSNFSILVKPGIVATPSNSTPANGGTNQRSSVTLSTSAFSWVGVSDTHLNSDWQLATDSNFTTIVQSTSADTTNKTSWTVSGLSVSTTYYWRVRYRGTANGVSSWSTGTNFITAASFGPSVIGQSYGGGYYGGNITDAGVEYYLIVAPANYRSADRMRWSIYASDYSSSTSRTNGPANSVILNSSQYPPGLFAKGCTAGGYTDWYLPAIDELRQIYLNLGTSDTSAPDFQTNGSQAFRNADVYWGSWSSTRLSTSNGQAYAHTLTYSGATESAYWLDSVTYVLPVRRIPV